MPRLRQVSGDEAIRALERLGFAQVRQRGSHVVLKKGENGCVIPRHSILAIGTLRGALKQAGVGVEDFLQSLE
jgi:predicted RNA binding protein YcfA (HicA-like mRNA interferase family)